MSEPEVFASLSSHIARRIAHRRLVELLDMCRPTIVVAASEFGPMIFELLFKIIVQGHQSQIRQFDELNRPVMDGLQTARNQGDAKELLDFSSNEQLASRDVANEVSQRNLNFERDIPANPRTFAQNLPLVNEENVDHGKAIETPSSASEAKKFLPNILINKVVNPVKDLFATQRKQHDDFYVASDRFEIDMRNTAKQYGRIESQLRTVYANQAAFPRMPSVALIGRRFVDNQEEFAAPYYYFVGDKQRWETLQERLRDPESRSGRYADSFCPIDTEDDWPGRFVHSLLAISSKKPREVLSPFRSPDRESIRLGRYRPKLTRVEFNVAASVFCQAGDTVLALG